MDMEDRIQKCDICEKILSIGDEKFSDKCGITWTFGYSKGGWGSREDKPCFSGEVCKECFEVFDKMNNAFNKEILFNRKGINKQRVKIA